MTLDDLGYPIVLPRTPRRVVSLVPSLTETLADSGRLVGATSWCTHPADLQVVRVRGTKNPDIRAIVALEPDLVVANKEENRKLDVQRLTAAGITVWVTDIDSVPAALRSLERLFTEALRLPTPQWLREAAACWGGPIPATRPRVAVAVWRDPWIVVGARTFTGDLLRRLGCHNVFDDQAQRYPTTDLAEIHRRDPDVVLLPDEPYPFTATDGPESFDVPTTLVDGRLLTWYGPSLAPAWHTFGGMFGR